MFNFIHCFKLPMNTANEKKCSLCSYIVYDAILFLLSLQPFYKLINWMVGWFIVFSTTFKQYFCYMLIEWTSYKTKIHLSEEMNDTANEKKCSLCSYIVYDAILFLLFTSVTYTLEIRLFE
jgi:uncharacterized Zn-finger protein